MTLVSAAELAAVLDDPDLRIADVRWSLAAPGGGHVAYGEAHLPGAVFVDLESVLTAPDGPGRHPLPEPHAFAAALAALGIGRRHRIVAYDDAGGTVAARLWWMLDALGHADAAVLDGGIGAWWAAGFPLTADVPAYPPAEPVATPGIGSAWPRTIDRPMLAERLGEVRLLDARAPERYRGEIEPVDRVPGHIPTAVSLPTSAFLGEGGRFLAPDALAARFAAVGVRGQGPDGGEAGPAGGEARPAGRGVPVGGDHARASDSGAPSSLDGVPVGSGGQVVVSCGSGVNASQLALAMRVAGLPDPLLYPGSYSDWTRSGMPIATGAEPGEPPTLRMSHDDAGRDLGSDRRAS